MSGWRGLPGVYEAPPRVDDSDSLKAMNHAAKAAHGASTTLEPVLPCQQGKAWLELTVLDSNGDPVADTDCILSIPEGNGLAQKTDARGYVKFEGVSADPQGFTVRLKNVSGDNGDSTWVVDVVPRQASAKTPASEEAVPLEARYVDLAWERESLIWSAGT